MRPVYSTASEGKSIKQVDEIRPLADYQHDMAKNPKTTQIKILWSIRGRIICNYLKFFATFYDKHDNWLIFEIIENIRD